MPAIYTRTGDKGSTGLFGGTRVAKQSLRVEAYGTVDEANSALGAAKAQLPAGDWRERVHHIQQRIFVLAAELASDEAGAQMLDGKVDSTDIADLEQLIDDCLEITGPQRSFVIPGRDERSAAFHVARTVVRRAERRTLTLAEVEPVRPELITYLNRASDAVYALARLCEHWADLARIEQVVRAAVEQHLAAEPSAASELGSVQVLDLATAQQLAAAAEARARELGVAIVFAVVDDGGQLILLHRMPGSLLASIEAATNKAWSAAAFKQPTAALQNWAADDGPFPGLAEGYGGRVVLFGGGAPVQCQGVLLGGLGVSGGSAEEDVDILTWAMTTVMGEQR